MIKRLFDIILSTLLLILLLPILIVISIIIFFKIGFPIFFKQERPGLNGKVFTMIKFRTMSNDIDENGVLLNENKRLLKFGKLLRSSSLDELPELWNVLKGDMSIVGPRPLLVEYLALYSSEQSRRHEAKPGITGWAQINGRNSISWEEKFSLDLWYVENQSFLIDIKVILITIVKVFNRDGVNQKKTITMKKFEGNK
ncbi:sugar transferase [Candidatus Pseudothioglobus singularis]|jgi:lipopolysaccharide/colanic/teichoic acid biosynthesis glycosyltransferase|nr:sugar transferase [Candidatus Pseudothioglobus singularis]MDB4822121.1 sugar transferase [Candidatus Pseudothioglobus singularis]